MGDISGYGAIAATALDSAFRAVSSEDQRIYDVFWTENNPMICVPWADSATRAVKLQKDDEGLWTNASALPSGEPTGSAKYAGSVYRGHIPPSKD